MLLTAYAGTWAFKVPLGIIRPATNLAYFCYSERDWLDQSLYVFYWPCLKLFPPGVIHVRDRVFLSPEVMGP